MTGIELARAFVSVAVNKQELSPGLKSAESEVASSMNRIQGMIAASMGAVSSMGAGVIASGLFNAGAFEQTQIAFQTMIGSIDETEQTLASLSAFAAKTPFNMPEIEKAARGLIQFGERGDELMDTLRILGNAAAGTNTPFADLATIFNQVRGVGRLLTEDFKQLAQRGVISLQDIANHFHVTTDEAQALLSTGKVSFGALRDILSDLSEGSGRFANLMEKQSQSLNGLWSTLTDTISITSRTLGQQLLPQSKDLLTTTIELANETGLWVQEHGALASSIIVTTTGVTGLAAAYTTLSIAARAAGISIKGALIGAGVGAAIVGVGVAAGVIAASLKETGVEAANLEHNAQSLYSEFQRGSAAEAQQIEKLRGLIGEQNMSNSAMKEAQDLVDALKAKYGDFGIQLDWTTNSIIGTYDALAKLEELRLSQQQELLTEALKESIANQQKLAEEIKTTADEMHAFNQISQTVKANGLQEELEKEAARAKDLAKQLREVKGALGGLSGGTDVELPDVKPPGGASGGGGGGGLGGGGEDSFIGMNEKDAAAMEEAFAGIREAQRKAAEGEAFRRSLMTPIDLAEEKIARIQEMMSDPTYGFSQEDGEKALGQMQQELTPRKAEPKDMLAAGSYGFADFSKSLQNSILNGAGAGSEQEVLNESKAQTQLLTKIEQLLAKDKPPENPGTLGP